MVSSTKSLRRVHNTPVEIEIKGKTVEKSMSEKILGVIMSNDLTWRHHFYGEPEKVKEDRSEGLLTALSKRIGIFRGVVKYAKGVNLRTLANGLFYSKLSYSLPLFAEVWIKEPYRYKPDSRKYKTKEEYRKLQVLQNRLERIIYSRENDVPEYEIKAIPTERLLTSNRMQSVHQMGAQSVLNTYRKIIKTGKPRYLYEQLCRQEGRRGHTWRVKTTPKLSVTTSKLIERGTKLWNMLSKDIKKIESNHGYKREVKKWTMLNIPIKPG